MTKKNYSATLYIVSAPSGAGKSSLINAYLNKERKKTRVAISHTTRQPRPGEVAGKHYFYINKSTFQTMVEQNDFIEYATVFDHYYGTSRKEIEGYLEKGIDVLLDIDWQGARQVRKSICDTISIFILPPSLDELQKRLIKRDQDQQQIVNKRMAQAHLEMSHYSEYDYLIINDDFDQAVLQLSTIIQSQALTVKKQERLHRHFLDSLGLD